MKLVLTLIGPPRLMGARPRYELQAGSLSVGRSPEADWVIADVDRLISRLHLRVDAIHGEFVLTDTSANGVFVNGGEPVGYGASVKLRDGDKLRAGEAQIAVAIESPVAAPPGTPLGLDADAFAHPLAATRTDRTSPDPLGGPFGAPITTRETPAPAAEQASPSSRIDANWMNPPPGPTVRPVAASAPSPTEQGDPVVLPLRPNLVVPAPRAAASEPRDVLDLVEALPELSIRQLAASIDAAGRAIDPVAWRKLRERLVSLLDRDVVAS